MLEERLDSTVFDPDFDEPSVESRLRPEGRLIEVRLEERAEKNSPTSFGDRKRGRGRCGLR
jgi:hypothetical protein